MDEKGKVRSRGLLGVEPELKAYGIDPGATKEALGLLVERFKIKNGADARRGVTPLR
jgi:hypothetical protein